MAKYDLSIREEEVKHKVARDWFANYDTTQVIDDIDFSVAIQPQGNELFKETEYLLWAEAKKGNIAPSSVSFSPMRVMVM